MTIKKIENKLNNLVLEYHDRLVDWLKTHTRLPKVIHNFINVDIKPSDLSLLDVIETKSKTQRVLKSKIVDEKTKTINQYKHLKLEKDPDTFVEVKTERVVEVKTRVEEISGEWVKSDSKSVIFCENMIGEVTYLENNPTQYSIMIEDSRKTLVMTSKMKTFLSEFPNVEILIDNYEDFVYVRKNLQRLIENDNLLSLVENGRIKFKEDIMEDVVIKYESKLNKLQDLLNKEEKILRKIENQRKTIAESKKKLMSEHEDYVYVIMNQEEKQLVCVDKQIFLASMALASKELRNATMSLVDHVHRGVTNYNNFARMMMDKQTAIGHLISFCDEADLQDLRIHPLSSELRRVDVVDAYDDTSDVDDEYETEEFD